MDDSRINSDGSKEANIDNFYFDNVVKTEGTSEKKPRSLISHLRGKAIQFYYRTFTENRKLSKDGKDFGKVSDSLRKEFGNKHELGRAVEVALSLYRTSGDDLTEFIEETDFAQLVLR